MLDFETVSFLKRVSQNLGIDLISEQYLNVENKLISNSQFNTNFTDILNSDLCLTVGTNIRFEASLLNVRIKKRAQKGNFTRASIGLTENCNHKNNSIGNSFSTLIKIAEGKHFFCKNLIKSKKPMIIIGTSVKKR
jgi:NADH dehydrogenase/NADH:ubiquinone oxidoreductase subunit G